MKSKNLVNLYCNQDKTEMKIPAKISTALEAQGSLEVSYHFAYSLHKKPRLSTMHYQAFTCKADV